MASDILFGWVLGIMTVILPYLIVVIYGLRKQIRFLAGPHEQKAQAIKKKSGLFGWMKKSYKNLDES